MVAGRCSEVIEAVVGMLVLLLGDSLVSFAAVETYCDGRQDGAQCYGVLGVEVDDQELSYTDVSVVQQRRRSGAKCRGRSGVQ
ncbi:hypothetical protein AMECASPLE_012907 [Ameca splendens]|uniref:Secreted protein n=1 Tax=Ameca splendens TaxID=208324 RepID=A0ABV0YZ58_9TELE